MRGWGLLLLVLAVLITAIHHPTYGYGIAAPTLRGEVAAQGTLAPTPYPTIESIAQPTPAPIAGQQAELWPGAQPCFDWHAGATDWCAPLGTPVASPLHCTFLTQGVYHDNPRYGAYVMCESESGVEWYIGHLDMATVNPLGFRPGDRINAGDQLGVVGWHFITTHVHVQLRRGGHLVGPEAWWGEWDRR